MLSESFVHPREAGWGNKIRLDDVCMIICVRVCERVGFTGDCRLLEVMEAGDSVGSEQHVLVVYRPLATALRLQLIV